MLAGMFGATTQSGGVVPVVASRYWRIHVTQVNNGGSANYCGIQELEMLISGADQTGSGSSLASSDFYGINGGGAFDGDLTTPDNSWVTSSPDVPSSPAWLRYDFGVGNDVAIEAFKIYAQNFAGGPARAPYDFRCQFSSDDTNWNTAYIGAAVGGWSAGAALTFTF